MSDTPLTQAEIDELRKLEQAATPAPWQHGFNDGTGKAHGDSNDHGGWILHPRPAMDRHETVISGGRDTWGVPEGVREPVDADFIAAARNALPKLLAMIERLQDEVAELEDRPPRVVSEERYRQMRDDE